MPSTSSHRRPLIWLSGADAELLDHSRQDRSRFAALGVLTMTTAAATAVLAAYGARTVLGLPLVAAVFAGIIFGAVTLTVDRALLSANRPRAGLHRVLPVVVLRTGLAAVLGYALAAPLVLAIFRPDVEALIVRSAEIANSSSMSAIQIESATAQRIRSLENELNALRYAAAVPDPVADDPSVRALQAEYDRVDALYRQATEAAACEFDGTCGSGRPGGGASYRAKVKHAKDLESQRSQAGARLRAGQAAAADNAAASAASSQAAAKSQIPEVEARLAELTSKQQASVDRLRAAQARGPGAADRLAALSRLQETNSAVRATWLLLWSLLTLLGVLPLLVRMVMQFGRPGLYEELEAVLTDPEVAQANDFVDTVRHRLRELGSVRMSEADFADLIGFLKVRLIALLGAGFGDPAAVVAGPQATVIEGRVRTHDADDRPPVTGGPGGGDRSPFGDAAGDAAGGPDADGLERFLAGESPTRVRVGDDFSLVARIVIDRPPPDAPAAAMRALAVGPDGVDVVLLVQVDSGLSGTDNLQTTIRVPYRRSTEPVRFPLRAFKEGLRRIRLSAWQGGTALAELELSVSAEDHRVDESNQRRLAPISSLRGEPGEVTMQVGFDGTRYSFQLISSRYLSEQVVARSLTDSPNEAVERTIDMLRRFATSDTGYGAANPYSPATARRWIRETGVGLWQDLVPDPIKEEYWELRQDISTFTIACADDRVPWELLHPLSRTEDHGFLAQQFPVLRRVIGQRSAPEISLRNAQFVVPPGAPANAAAEVVRLREILRNGPAESISHLDELLDVLDGDAAGLLHFACHNTFSLDNGGSSIKMDGGPFIPQMLNSAVTRQTLADRHPLVFVNACRSAGAAPEYTQMMSWASQFMKAGAGAFVGTLWPVNSDRAAAFAEVFYADLAAGKSLGQATLRARTETEQGADPTWLAYSTYGDSAATAA